MKILKRIRTLLPLLLVALHSLPAAEPAKPNVVFILADDLGVNDLAAAQPDQVKQLAARLEHYLSDTEAVIPIANPAFNPNAKPLQNKAGGAPKQKP